jgi:putative endonuclease
MWYFYVLQSQKTANYFYKGSTSNLQRRLAQHENGEVVASAPHKPFKLVYYEAYLFEHAARQRESSVKKSGAVWGALMARIKKSLTPSRSQDSTPAHL